MMMLCLVQDNKKECSRKKHWEESTSELFSISQRNLKPVTILKSDLVSLSAWIYGRWLSGWINIHSWHDWVDSQDRCSEQTIISVVSWEKDRYYVSSKWIQATYKNLINNFGHVKQCFPQWYNSLVATIILQGYTNFYKFTSNYIHLVTHSTTYVPAVALTYHPWTVQKINSTLWSTHFLINIFL